jgi:uncharacterized protein
VTDRLPLFPLSTVLFPGLVLPLHVFEDRYRALVRDLATEADEGARRFGVVAIREGYEVGEDAAPALHEVGCVARVREVDERDDGTFDLVTVGADRFRLEDVDATGAYLVGGVTVLDEPEGEESAVLSASVRQVFARYRQALLAAQGRRESQEPDLPDDAVTLSYLVAAATVLFVPEKQQLLAAPDAAARLKLERDVLHREASLLRHLPSLPAVELLSHGVTTS